MTCDLMSVEQIQREVSRLPEAQPNWKNRAHFFSAAAVMGISERTAKRDWAYARAGLFGAMKQMR